MAINGEGLIVEMGGEDFEITRYNTQLYTFMGRLATRNHIFIITRETDEEVHGVHIWKAFQPDAYDGIAHHMAQHNYPMYLNLNEVAECDEQAFDRAVQKNLGDVGDFIPEEFES